MWTEYCCGEGKGSKRTGCCGGGRGLGLCNWFYLRRKISMTSPICMY